jgi:hypothetical protein
MNQGSEAKEKKLEEVAGATDQVQAKPEEIIGAEKAREKLEEVAKEVAKARDKLTEVDAAIVKAKEILGEKKSNCLARMLNKICSEYSNRSEFKEIKATLKDMQEEMRKGKEPKKYGENYVPETVEKIDRAVSEIGEKSRRIHRASVAMSYFSIVAAGAISATVTWQMQHGANAGLIVAGLIIFGIAGAQYLLDDKRNKHKS